MLPSLLLSALPSMSLLNVSHTVSFSKPQPTIASSTSIYCLKSLSTHAELLVPTTYSACKRAIKSIPLGDAGLKPVTFSRSSSSGFQTPHAWNSGDCAVEIDVIGAGVTETATFAELLMVALEVAAGCVIPGPHFGGKAVIGPEKGLELFVYGIREAPQLGNSSVAEE